jgi:hypothetical protein
MPGDNYFRDLEAEYIAAALSDDSSDQEHTPASGVTESIWSGYVQSEDGVAVYAIGEREDVVITDDLLNGYLFDDPFAAAIEPEFQAQVITSVIAVVGHVPTENEVVDALSEAFIT